jgi:hypothetical protein
MKIKKKLFSVSIPEMIKLTLFILLLVNVLAYFYALALGESYFAIFRSAWIILIGYPIAHGMIQSRLNRNGVLIVSQYENAELLKKEIEYIAERIGYEVTSRDEKSVNFNRLTGVSKFLNRLYREDFSLVLNENSVEIHGKRNTLFRINKRLKAINQ